MRPRITAALATMALCSLAACSMHDLVDVKTPSTIPDPSSLKSYQGAVLIYNGAKTYFLQTFMGTGGAFSGPFAVASGLLADEYQIGQFDAIDARTDEETATNIDDPATRSTAYGVYQWLSLSRVQAGQAIGYLEAYGQQAPASYIGEMYIIRGFSEVFIGEMYCSGVPLSEAVFDGDVTYGSPLTTEQMQEHAIAQFDSAMTYVKDSADLVNLVKLGRARALMNLKRYDEAAAEVADVPTDYSYDLAYSRSAQVSAGYWNTSVSSGDYVSDHEGINGLDFISAHDPRVVLDSVGTIGPGVPQMAPRAYRLSTFTIPLENGIDARLIEAEDLLSQGKTAAWLAALNALRTTCTDNATCPTPAPAGTGGIAGLPPLSDPGALLAGQAATNARVEMQFRERAFWLFGQGHRQGDLRRLVRQYGFRQNQVYPTGPYHVGLNQSYGPYTNVTPGGDEYTNNPNYHGCLNRDA